MASTRVVHLPKGPFNRTGFGTIRRQPRQLKSGMLLKPLMDCFGFVNNGVINYPINLKVTRDEGNRSYFLALPAELYGKVGQTEEGLSVVAEALSFVDNSDERFYEAEIYRLKREEVRELLKPVYSWFTEEFDTTDLRRKSTAR